MERLLKAMRLDSNYSCWAIEKDKFDEIDAAWCYAFGIQVKVYPIYHKDRWVSDSIRLVTENEAQVAMLKFKYDYRLVGVSYDPITKNENFT